jgi:hypothetical protein
MRALVAGIVVWLLARHVVKSNPLAIPMTVFAIVILQHAAMLLGNHRSDLLANAIFELAVLGIAAIWLMIPGRADA